MKKDGFSHLARTLAARLRFARERIAVRNARDVIGRRHAIRLRRIDDFRPRHVAIRIGPLAMVDCVEEFLQRIAAQLADDDLVVIRHRRAQQLEIDRTARQRLAETAGRRQRDVRVYGIAHGIE